VFRTWIATSRRRSGDSSPPRSSCTGSIDSRTDMSMPQVGLLGRSCLNVIALRPGELRLHPLPDELFVAIKQSVITTVKPAA